MAHFLEALNRPADAYQKQRKGIAWLLVTITIIITTVFEPALRMFSTPEYHVDVLGMVKISVYGFISYLLICLSMWLICKCLGSKTVLSAYIKTWGISFIPDVICALTVTVTEIYFYVFWNSVLWGMIFSILYVGILIWKIVLYVIFLREIAGLQRVKLAVAFFVIAVLIAVLAALNGYVGLKTPIL